MDKGSREEVARPLPRPAGRAGGSRAGWGLATGLQGSQERGDLLTRRRHWVSLRASFCRGCLQADPWSELLVGQPEGRSPIKSICGKA